MLLKKNRGHQLSALSLCLAVMFAPLLSALRPMSLKLYRQTVPRRWVRSRRRCHKLAGSPPATAILAGIRPLPEGIDTGALRQQLLTGASCRIHACLH